ncbi:hypothetical protein VNO80_11789 [Phaseolus coccineus]|uniref:Uncharacterized protein n=1 Tax=Phaseolus coccineus TaxID=3886 RepID=A0AAN9NB19_PHACN
MTKRRTLKRSRLVFVRAFQIHFALSFMLALLKLGVAYAHYEHAPLLPHSSLTLSSSSPFTVGFLCLLSLAGFQNPRPPVSLTPNQINSNPIQSTRLNFFNRCTWVLGVRLLYSRSFSCCFMKIRLISNRCSSSDHVVRE